MHTFKFSTHNTPQTGRMKLKVLRWTHHSGLVPPWDDLDNVIKGTSVMCLWYHCHLTTTVFFLLTNSRLRRQPCSLMVTRLWSGVPCTLYLVLCTLTLYLVPHTNQTLMVTRLWSGKSLAESIAAASCLGKLPSLSITFLWTAAINVTLISISILIQINVTLISISVLIPLVRQASYTNIRNGGRIHVGV